MDVPGFPLGVTAVMLPELDFAEQLSLCRSLGLTHYSLRPRDIAESQRDKPYSNWGNHRFDLTPARLVKEAKEIRARILDAGLKPFGTVPVLECTATCEAAMLHFEGAAAVGAGRVRVGTGGYPSDPFDYAALVKERTEGYARMVEWARPFGLKLVIETHAGSLASGPALARRFCEPFSPAEVGVIFDLPNFAREGLVPAILAVSVLRDYIDHCHVGGSRRVHASVDAAGFPVMSDQFCSLKEGDLNLPQWLKALGAAGLSIPLIIEDYTPGMPGEARLRRSVEEVRSALAG